MVKEIITGYDRFILTRSKADVSSLNIGCDEATSPQEL